MQTHHFDASVRVFYSSKHIHELTTARFLAIFFNFCCKQSAWRYVLLYSKLHSCSVLKTKFILTRSETIRGKDVWLHQRRLGIKTAPAHRLRAPAWLSFTFFSAKKSPVRFKVHSIWQQSGTQRAGRFADISIRDRSAILNYETGKPGTAKMTNRFFLG